MTGASFPATTAPPPPPEAEQIFGAELPRAIRYAALLSTVGVERGLIGPREAERIWPRHLLNAAALAPFVPAGAQVLDLGSGAGLPGIPLALARPDLTVTLVEPMSRRVAFLELVRDELALAVAVTRARAQELPDAVTDVVVARAVAPLTRLVPLTVRLVRPAGMVLALKGAGAGTEIDNAAAALSGCGAVASLHEVTIAGERTGIVRVTLGAVGVPPVSPGGQRARPQAQYGEGGERHERHAH